MTRLCLGRVRVHSDQGSKVTGLVLSCSVTRAERLPEHGASGHDRMGVTATKDAWQRRNDGAYSMYCDLATNQVLNTTHNPGTAQV